MLFVGNNRGYTSLMMASSGGRKDLNDSPSFGKSEGNQKESAADQTQQIRGGENTQDTPPNPDEGELRRAVGLFMKFQRQQRDHYYEVGLPIATTTKAFLTRFFDPALLGQVRVVKMAGDRVPNPSFFKEAEEKGYKNLPDLKHLSSVTFLDVVVFNEKIVERSLFHGLVLATQVQVLGLERFADLFVRGFLRAKSYFMVPLKAHAFALDCQFAENRERGFSVETEVVRWVEEGRY